MRVGRWTKEMDYGEGSASNAGFPPMPDWFPDSRGFNQIEHGLKDVGMSSTDIERVMGGNWLRFFDQNFGSLNSAP
jgi:microsomal dipeptidase-like Zn-dependent dipeptidase